MRPATQSTAAAHRREPGSSRCNQQQQSTLPQWLSTNTPHQNPRQHHCLDQVRRSHPIHCHPTSSQRQVSCRHYSVKSK
eukprot:UN13051